MTRTVDSGELPIYWCARHSACRMRLSFFAPIFVLASALLVATGCSRPDSPESQLRQAIAAMEKAAEERDVDDVMEWVSPEFRGAGGQDPQALRRYLQGFFIVNQSIHLLTRIDALDFPAPDEARLHLTVGMVSREAESASAWDLAAEVQQFQLALRRTNEEWRVIYAKRAPD